MAIVDFENVGFSYDGSSFVLDGIDLRIEQGEFLCILGGNGSGKSTLAKHINALLVPDAGRVEVLGRSTADDSATYFIRSNAGMVFQNPDDQLVASLIENDVAFGPENLGVPADELRRRVTESLAQVGLQGFERKETTALSGGQKQRVAIAGVLAMQPQILILDEASAMLDPRGRKGLLRVAHELNDAGMTVVMITHFMEEAAQADRVAVLDGGTVALQGTPETVLTDVAHLESLALDVPFAAKMSRLLQARGMDVPTEVDEAALLDDIAACHPSVHENAIEPAAAPAMSDDPLIEFDDVWYTYDAGSEVKKRKRKQRGADAPAADWGNRPDSFWALQSIDFTLRRGEFLGVAGHTGSGKSTLIQHMNGLMHPTRGRVLVNGVDICGKAEASAAREDVGLVFQYPENQLFAATVFDDVAFGPRNQGHAAEAVRTRVEEALRQVEMDPDEISETSPFELSGGQQRRVAFAGVLAMRPTTLILDEPVAGLDPEAREDFLQLIAHLHDRDGLTVVMVSHSMDDLARLSDRVLVLNMGRLFALDTPEAVFADAGKLDAIGLGAPAAQRLADGLRASGVPLPRMLYDEQRLADALAGRALEASHA